eukprot:TRINITY_DN9550_c0_g1_i1.p1 TRINITY_DN9550_c0_g1~~TRINITY_DN9550_c0_g1_i1.p1  ORF type:complete len:145 (-),score=53.31 TRINITY_DN9550_c0_g1_i1:10-381(-)
MCIRDRNIERVPVREVHEEEAKIELHKISEEHEKLIDVILEEEDQLIDSHKRHIDAIMELSKTEMSLLQEVSKPGSDIDEYVKGLNSILEHKLEIISVLRSRCLLYTSPSPRDQRGSRMPSSA